MSQFTTKFSMKSMKSFTTILVIFFCWNMTPSILAEDWPLYFDKLTKDKYIMVVLYEKGKAEYLEHEILSDGSLAFLHDEAATWGYHDPSIKNARPNIWLKLNKLRLDYYLEESRLTEIDKMGVQNILTKRKNRINDAKR